MVNTRILIAQLNLLECSDMIAVGLQMIDTDAPVLTADIHGVAMVMPLWYIDERREAPPEPMRLKSFRLF